METHGCQGGAHAGYVRAGFLVTGVDINKAHARYYPGKLIIADAASYIRKFGANYDAIHTSPACQWYTRGNAQGRATGNSKWQRSIPPIREALESIGKPYIIENVTDAGWDMRDPVALCGCMFDLNTIDTDGVRIHLKRERLFETNWGMTAPRPCNHTGIDQWAGAYGGARRDKYEARFVRKGGYVPPDKQTVAALLGVTHNMTWNGLFECLPPAYTEYVGTQLKNVLIDDRVIPIGRY